MVQFPATAYPPHRLSLDLGVILFTRLVSHTYDLSLESREGQCQFIGRIEERSNDLWAVTHIDCQACVPEYFDDWQQATLFLSRVL